MTIDEPNNKFLLILQISIELQENMEMQLNIIQKLLKQLILILKLSLIFFIEEEEVMRGWENTH